MSSTNYETPAIARDMLQEYPVIRIPECVSTQPAASQAEDTSAILRFAHFLVERSGASRLLIMDDMGLLRSRPDYSQDDIVLIRNGLRSLQRCPELAEPLKDLCQANQKVILADDSDAFPDARIAEALLQRHGVPVEFCGYVNGAKKKMGTLALLSTSKPSLPIKTPDSFRVIALIASFNEEDVIVPVIERLHENGIDVYLIDNWLTDDTYQRAQSLLGRGLIGLERFPRTGPSATFDLEEQLKRKEELCSELKADWFIHHDADEIHESPWKGMVCGMPFYGWISKATTRSILHCWFFPPWTTPTNPARP